jgi:hypothetical protein
VHTLLPPLAQQLPTTTPINSLSAMDDHARPLKN